MEKWFAIQSRTFEVRATNEWELWGCICIVGNNSLCWRRLFHSCGKNVENKPRLVCQFLFSSEKNQSKANKNPLYLTTRMMSKKPISRGRLRKHHLSISLNDANEIKKQNQIKKKRKKIRNLHIFCLKLALSSLDHVTCVHNAPAFQRRQLRIAPPRKIQLGLGTFVNFSGGWGREWRGGGGFH